MPSATGYYDDTAAILAERQRQAEEAAAAAAAAGPQPRFARPEDRPPPTSQTPASADVPGAQSPMGALGAVLGGFGAPVTPAGRPQVEPPPPGPNAPPIDPSSVGTRAMATLGNMPVLDRPVTPATASRDDEYASVRPLPPGQAPGPSLATSAIVQARDTGTEPVVEGGQSALGSAVGAVTDAARRAVEPTKVSPVVAEAPIPKAEAPVPPPKKEAPPAATVVQSGAPQAPQAAPTKVDLKKPIEAKGAPGGRSAPSALAPRAREELPPANTKAIISPTFLVELEKSNPALHDGIIQAATAAGIGAWDYANLVYGSSKGDPNYNQGGRVGLAGLTQADIDRYQARPDTAALFRDARGNPVTAQDPHTNLMLGAVKYREMSDRYGTRNPQAILAYHIGADKVDSLSRLTPKEQQSMIPAEEQARVQQSIAGPDTGAVKPTPVNLQPPGTMTPTGVAQAAFAAARTGNVMPFIGYVANGVPRGSGPTDSWRYAENAMVAAMMAKGDMVGAQHARELVFQMSHAGAVQSFMSAYRQMQIGDYHGAAQSMALGYWAAPDGGLVQFAVGKDKNGNDVMYGQRYNEETRKPLGSTFQVRPQDVLDLTSMARDPATFQKMVNENRKLNHEIANKDADTQYKQAHTKKVLGDDRRADEAAGDKAGATVLRETRPAKAGAADKPDPREAHVDAMVKDMFDKGKDLVTQAPLRGTPDENFQADLFKSLLLNDGSLSAPGAWQMAGDILKGKARVSPMTGAKQGWGAVLDAKGNKIGELRPSVMTRARPSQPATSEAPPVTTPPLSPPPAPGLGAR